VFDNVDIDDVAKIALKWEQGIGLIRGGDIASRDRRWASGNSLTVLSSEKVGDLAKDLCEKARENSLDNATDSPFAMLAKDNDIMWSGGKSLLWVYACYYYTERTFFLFIIILSHSSIFLHALLLCLYCTVLYCTILLL